METENKPKPPSTAKFDAYVQMRRDDQHKKLQEKEQKAQEDEMRTLKQLRLTNRVKQSPAISNNQKELNKKRKHSIQRAKDKMK